MGKNGRKAPTNVILAVRGKISARLLFSQHVRIGSRYTKLFVSGFPPPTKNLNLRLGVETDIVVGLENC
jgi:hypothetical protein